MRLRGGPPAARDDGASAAERRRPLLALRDGAAALGEHDGSATAGVAALVAGPARVEQLQALEATLAKVARSQGSTIEAHDDEYAFRWLIVRAEKLDALLDTIDALAGTLSNAGEGDRLLCAVFAFDGPDGAALELVYNFSRGLWYPFVADGDARQHLGEREDELAETLADTLPIEPELERWFPLWSMPF